MSQAGLFQTEELKQCRVQAKTPVTLGRRSAQVPLARRNRKALTKLKEILTELEGKDVLVSQQCDFWWYQGLRLSRLKIRWGAPFGNHGRPSVIALSGNRSAEMRI